MTAILTNPLRWDEGSINCVLRKSRKQSPWVATACCLDWTELPWILPLARSLRSDSPRAPRPGRCLFNGSFYLASTPFCREDSRAYHFGLAFVFGLPWLDGMSNEGTEQMDMR